MLCPFAPPSSSGSCAELEAEIAQLRRLLALSQSENALLTANNEALRVENHRLSLAVAQLHDEVAGLESRVEDLTNQLQQAKSDAATLREKVNELAADVELLEGQVNALSKINKQLKSKLTELSKQLQRIRIPIRRLANTMQTDVMIWHGVPWFEAALGPIPTDYGVDYRTVGGNWRAGWWKILKDGYSAADHLWFKPREHGPQQLTDAQYPCWLYRTYDPDPPDPKWHRSGIADAVMAGDAPVKWGLQLASNGAVNFGNRLTRYVGLLKEIVKPGPSCTGSCAPAPPDRLPTACVLGPPREVDWVVLDSAHDRADD